MRTLRLAAVVCLTVSNVTSELDCGRQPQAEPRGVYVEILAEWILL